MTSFDICSFEDFIAEATPQSGSLEEAASTQEILIQQLEGYLNRMREAVCADVTNLQTQITNIVPGGGLPDIPEGVEVPSGRQLNGINTFFKLIDCGTLGNNASVATPHNIVPTAPDTDFETVVGVGWAKDPGGSQVPMTFAASFTTNSISFFLDATNVTTLVGANRTAFTTVWVLLEYYYI